MTKNLIFLVCAITGTSRLEAQVTFYTDQAEFTKAAGSPSSFGFNSLVSGSQSMGYSTAQGLTLQGFNFVGTTGNSGSPYRLGVSGPNFYSNDYNTVPGASSLQAPASSSPFYAIPNGKLTIKMPGNGVSAFGILLFEVLTGTVDGSGTDVVNLAVGSSVGTTTVPPKRTGFIGFISATPITSIVLTGTNVEEFPTLSQIFYVLFVAAPPTPSGLKLLSGDNQMSPAGAAFANPIIVQLIDTAAKPVAGAKVAFNVSGDASLSATTATTASDGTASVRLTAGAISGGPVQVNATASAYPAVPAISIQNLTALPPVLPPPPTFAPALDGEPSSYISTTAPGFGPTQVSSIQSPFVTPATTQGINDPVCMIPAGDTSSNTPWWFLYTGADPSSPGQQFVQDLTGNPIYRPSSILQMSRLKPGVVGFQAVATFGGSATPVAGQGDIIETVFFHEDPCFTAHREFGFLRYVAANLSVFYWSTNTNCSINGNGGYTYCRSTQATTGASEDPQNAPLTPEVQVAIRLVDGNGRPLIDPGRQYRFLAFLYQEQDPNQVDLGTYKFRVEVWDEGVQIFGANVPASNAMSDLQLSDQGTPGYVTAAIQRVGNPAFTDSPALSLASLAIAQVGSGDSAKRSRPSQSSVDLSFQRRRDY